MSYRLEIFEHQPAEPVPPIVAEELRNCDDRRLLGLHAYVSAQLVIRGMCRMFRSDGSEVGVTRI